MGWGEIPKPRVEHPKSGIRRLEEAEADHDALDEIANEIDELTMGQTDAIGFCDRVALIVGRVRRLQSG